MAEEKQNGLDELFSKYEERKQKESEKEKIRQSEQKALRDKTIELITKTIIPVMEEFKKKCEAKGYHAEIERMIGHPIYPYVEFSFTLKYVPAISLPKISFSHSDAGKIKIEVEINTDKSRQSVSGHGGIIENYGFGVGGKQQEVEKVTEQDIKINLKLFIQKVLETN